MFSTLIAFDPVYEQLLRKVKQHLDLAQIHGRASHAYE